MKLWFQKKALIMDPIFKGIMAIYMRFMEPIINQ